MLFRSRAEVKTKTLKELSNESNPLTEVNSSSELLEKVQILAQSLEDKTQELSELYKSNEKALLDSYGESIANYSNQINSASTPDEIIALFPQIESLFKEIEGNTRFVSNNSESTTLTENIQNLANSYSDKAEQYSDAFMNEMGAQISLLNENINALRSNIDYLTSHSEVQSHLERLSEIREQVNASASIYKNYPGARDMVYNLDTLSISTHARVQEMADSNEIVSELMPLVNEPELLVRAVKEAAIRTDVATVENILIPLTNNANDLSAKVVELASRYDSGNYGDIKVRAVSNFDKTVERLDRQYIAIRSTDPEALAVNIKDLSNNIESNMGAVRSVDPASQSEYFLSLKIGRAHV